MPPDPYTTQFISGPDGLLLHLRDYGSRESSLTPVVCLPGLTRPCGDFHALALRLSAKGRRVLAIDYRGRGLSQWDKDWKRYDVFVESADIQTMLVASGVPEAIFVGTSRGGLHIMALAALKPSLIKAAVLNDIGPIIEPAGLQRIKGYLGKITQPDTLAQAVTMLKSLFGEQFTNVSEADWDIYAQLTYPLKNGKMGPGFDPNLFKTLEALNPDTPLPVLWPQFDGLRNVPLLVIRGANSDLLSPATFEAMLNRRTQMAEAEAAAARDANLPAPNSAPYPPVEGFVVEGQGHAPLLLDEASLARIEAFVQGVDATAL